jgi:hypothetical protein
MEIAISSEEKAANHHTHHLLLDFLPLNVILRQQANNFKVEYKKSTAKKSYLFYCSGSKTAVTIYFIFINKG